MTYSLAHKYTNSPRPLFGMCGKPASKPVSMHALKTLPGPATVREQLQQRLADVLTEQEFRVKITAPAAQG